MRAVRHNPVKQKLARGERVYGTSLEDCLDPEMPVLLRAAGLDFFFVDTEHCVASYAQIKALCRVALGQDIVPLVRVTQNDPALITRALDMGVMGVIVPRVHSRAEAERALDGMKFPPLGHRGFGLHAIVTDHGPDPPQRQVESANQETMAVLMIESRSGLEAVEEIARLPSLDVLFIGPHDLTLALGILGQFDHPLFHDAVSRVVAACNATGIAAGLQTGDMDLVLRARQLGVRFLMYSSDTGILLQGYRAAMATLREEKSR
ncbi:MAG TPA: aldolase/citrate lyase family protein [Acidobacteriaceae bacterium]|nr:aldolase/citrate lyase family protein [Acidobacteriaceae bacterium]